MADPNAPHSNNTIIHINAFMTTSSNLVCQDLLKDLGIQYITGGGEKVNRYDILLMNGIFTNFVMTNDAKCPSHGDFAVKLLLLRGGNEKRRTRKLRLFDPIMNEKHFSYFSSTILVLTSGRL
jgi:hypothetical protein